MLIVWTRMFVSRLSRVDGAGLGGRGDYLANGLDRMEAMGAGEPGLRADLAAADLLPDDPAVLFTLLDEPYRRRLNAVFELAHE